MSDPRVFAYRIGLYPAALLFALLVSRVVAQEPSLALHVTPDRVKQGGIAIVRVTGAGPQERLQLRVGGREAALGPPASDLVRTAWIGVDLEQAPGSLDVILEGTTAAGRPVNARAAFVVGDGHYPVQRLTVPRSFTELDAATLERVAREKKVMDHLWDVATPTRMWRGPFRSPLQDAGHGSGFGMRRIINGEPRAPHTGVDFSIPAGTSVLATNAGVVVLVDEQFFAGKCVVLDHGEGLYTMYFHLQARLVSLGQRVAMGEPIGRVGSTGRATGPHLHWGARIYGARIDPEELFQLSPE